MNCIISHRLIQSGDLEAKYNQLNSNVASNESGTSKNSMPFEVRRGSHLFTLENMWGNCLIHGQINSPCLVSMFSEEEFSSSSCFLTLCRCYGFFILSDCDFECNFPLQTRDELTTGTGPIWNQH